MAKLHMKNAKFFKDEAKKIESIFSGEPQREIPTGEKEKHKAYAVSGIYSVVSALESYANEFVKHIKDEYERIESNQDRLKYTNIEADMIKKITNYYDEDYNDPLEKVPNVDILEASIVFLK